MWFEPSVGAILALGLGAAVSDVRTRRIPNVLTFGGTAAAFVFFLFERGIGGLGWSALGWVVGCGLFLPFFLLRGMGAGDVKLLALIGSWLGPLLVLRVALYGAIAGGIVGIAVALVHGYLSQALWNVWFLLRYWRINGPRPVPTLTLADAKGPRVAYAVPIVAGMVAALWLR
jgi:prepilin peptidase CpaA